MTLIRLCESTERQQEAAYLVLVLGVSQREAGRRMKLSLAQVQRLLAAYRKNAA